MLVKEFLPDIEHHHKRQTLGMEGPNLAKKWCWEILTHAPKTLVEKIKKIDDLRFEVQSSNSLKYYQVDLSIITCTCNDFLNICLCKHIAATVHFFGGADLGPLSPPDRSDGNGSELAKNRSPGRPVGHRAVDDNAAASILSAANRIMSNLQQLMINVPRNAKFAKSLNVIQLQFSALVLSATMAENGSQLLKKEYIAPNQHS